MKTPEKPVESRTARWNPDRCLAVPLCGCVTGGSAGSSGGKGRTGANGAARAAGWHTVLLQLWVPVTSSTQHDYFFFSPLFWICVCVGWCLSPSFHPSLSQSSAHSTHWHVPPASPDQSCENWPFAILLCVNEALSLSPFLPLSFIITPLPEAGFSGWSSTLFISVIFA